MHHINIRDPTRKPERFCQFFPVFCQAPVRVLSGPSNAPGIREIAVPGVLSVLSGPLEPLRKTSHIRKGVFASMSFTLFRSDSTENLKNCLYPHRVTVSDEETLREAVNQDYVAAEYRDYCRSVSNFLRSDCLALDCDNDHSDNPADWLTPEKLMELFPDTTVGIHFSRHNNLPKGNRSPRPRFHCFFRMEEMTDATAYKQLKERVQRCCPFFDTHSLDAARFFFGTDNPGVLFRAGTISLNECLDMYYPDDPFSELTENRDIIPEGRRNSVMHEYAVRILKRCGLTDEARESYIDQSKMCIPPLEPRELQSIWNSAVKFYREVIATSPDYIRPEDYNGTQVTCRESGQPVPAEEAATPRAAQPEEETALSGWIMPLPLTRYEADPFPVEALPKAFADYAAAVAESTQTPVDMAGTAAISIMSLCMQGRYRIQGKPDWVEPLNTYAVTVATPSERKSAVLNLMIKPVNSYEIQFNIANAEALERNQMEKRALQLRQADLEKKKAKEQASESELEQIAADMAAFREIHPLRLYVDDITTEKLASVLSANGGLAAMVSSEGGIFDILAGTYSSNVNIDVMLKAYSGDTIRVDRVGRPSENIMDPALTVLLMVQPSVISAVLANNTFQGRGLTARFLYCVPSSRVGQRQFDSRPISREIKQKYYEKITNMLSKEIPDKPALIVLSREARQELSVFAQEIERRLVTDCSEIADWTGKLVGNVLRIAGLLCCCETEQTEENRQPVVSGEIMRKAICLGRYFLSHARVAFDVMPTKAMYVNGVRVLKMLRKKALPEFDRRMAMRNCAVFKTITEIQPVLDFLEDYGYIFEIPVSQYGRTGRPPLPRYRVNRRVLEQDLDALIAG